MANPVPIFAPSHLAMVCLHPSWCNDLFNAMCKKSVTYDLWKTTSLKLENKSWREFFHQLETPKLRYFQYLSKRMLHVFQAIHVLDFVELPTGPQQINTSSCIISKKMISQSAYCTFFCSDKKQQIEAFNNLWAIIHDLFTGNTEKVSEKFFSRVPRRTVKSWRDYIPLR